MSGCDRNAVRRLVRDDLSLEETVLLEDHLSGCSTCREELEFASCQDADSHRVIEWLSSSAEISSWSNSVSMQFDSAQKLASIGTGEAQGLDHSPDLSILSPSDDPTFLGRIGNYEVQGVIGRGGMGLVFRALDRSLNRHVAIKVLDPALASVGTARQRFGMEARAMAAISHEHVVPVYSVDVHRGLPYFAMEYIPGGTLEARIRQHGPLDLISILQIARQVAMALAAAHECGLVHRDIKPANILLDRGVERVRVADFGLARVSSDASFTRSGFIAGTPQFMSPEQVRGELCTELSDLFSLGSVMYAMCTGHSPFRSDSMYGSMQRVVYETPKPIAEYSPWTTQWLEDIIFKLLSKNPKDRFENAIQVAQLLELEIAHLQNPMRFPKPERKEYASRKKLSRPTPLIAWSFVALVAVIMACIWMDQSNRIQHRNSDLTNVPPSESTTVETPEHPNYQPPSSVVLWNSDGLDQALRSATWIENSFRGSDPIPFQDPWSRKVSDLARQLREFEQETR